MLGVRWAGCICTSWRARPSASPSLSRPALPASSLSDGFILSSMINIVKLFFSQIFPCFENMIPPNSHILRKYPFSKSSDWTVLRVWASFRMECFLFCGEKVRSLPLICTFAQQVICSPFQSPVLQRVSVAPLAGEQEVHQLGINIFLIVLWIS